MIAIFFKTVNFSYNNDKMYTKFVHAMILKGFECYGTKCYTINNATMVEVICLLQDCFDKCPEICEIITNFKIGKIDNLEDGFKLLTKPLK